MHVLSTLMPRLDRVVRHAISSLILHDEAPQIIVHYQWRNILSTAILSMHVYTHTRSNKTNAKYSWL